MFSRYSPCSSSSISMTWAVNISTVHSTPICRAGRGKILLTRFQQNFCCFSHSGYNDYRTGICRAVPIVCTYLWSIFIELLSWT
jgi:hypothetical protein